MKVQLKRINDDVNFAALNSDGNEILIDGPPSIGGVQGGFRPMELVLASVGSCSVMDLVAILKKQRQDLKDIQINIEGERFDTGDVHPFKSIHLTYHLFGRVDDRKAGRAVELAVTKYCSVVEMLKASVDITYSYEIHQADVAREGDR